MLVTCVALHAAPDFKNRPAGIPAVQPVGQVSELSGEAFAVRSDRERMRLTADSAVYQDDVIETSPGARLRMLFIDGTDFLLGEGARLNLDGLVYRPSAAPAGAAEASLKRIFIRLSGNVFRRSGIQASATDRIATIGIRG